MNRIRIGKDFKVRWSLFYKNGDPHVLESEKLILRLVSPFGKAEVDGFTVNGNLIGWTFRGRDQKYIGKYALELVEKNGIDGMLTVDTVDAFELVAHTFQESLGDDGNVSVDTIELVSGITNGIDVIDQFLDFEIDDNMHLNLTYISSNSGMDLNFQLTEDGYLTVDN